MHGKWGVFKTWGLSRRLVNAYQVPGTYHIEIHYVRYRKHTSTCYIPPMDLLGGLLASVPTAYQRVGPLLSTLVLPIASGRPLVQRHARFLPPPQRQSHLPWFARTRRPRSPSSIFEAAPGHLPLLFTSELFSAISAPTQTSLRPLGLTR